jgi:hypothetical protein
LKDVGPCARIAVLVGALAVSAAAHAESGWVLWERPVDSSTGQGGSPWQKRQRFEAERWCRGAMTRAINQTLTGALKRGRWDPRAKVTEYQCLPEGTEPPKPASR